MIFARVRFELREIVFVDLELLNRCTFETACSAFNNWNVWNALHYCKRRASVIAVGVDATKAHKKDGGEL
jgi:hypothetical protein